eukprot:COSAG06_NODE_417_length_15986_cov_832.025493_7_plen_84_part_00
MSCTQEEFEIDINGKLHGWEAVVLLPFIDEAVLLRAIKVSLMRHALPCLVLSCLVLSCLALLCLVLPCLVLSCQANPGLTRCE